jgi:chaperonin cofactor prefoldin
MIISNQPWSLETKSDGFTYVKDANGDEIGKFLYWQDAMFLVEELPKQLEEAKIETTELASEIEKLELHVEDLREEVAELHSKL